MNIHTFTRAYLECGLWTEADDDQENLDANYSLEDIEPESRAKALADCKAWVAANADVLEQSGLTAEAAGHNFWLTSCGHGTGFWDRGLEDVGDKLTEACEGLGEPALYVGEDGKVYYDRG